MTLITYLLLITEKKSTVKLSILKCYDIKKYQEMNTLNMNTLYVIRRIHEWYYFLGNRICMFIRNNNQMCTCIRIYEEKEHVYKCKLFITIIFCKTIAKEEQCK